MSQANEGKLQGNANMTDEEKLALSLAMMDSSYDDIADLPDFLNFPVGSYLIDFTKAEQGLNKEKTAAVIKVIVELAEVIELAKYPNVPVSEIPVEELPAVGSMTSFSWNGPLGIQKFKKIFGDMPAKLGATTPRQFLEMLGSGQVRGVAIVVTQRPDPVKVKIDPVTGESSPVMYSELVSASLVG